MARVSTGKHGYSSMGNGKHAYADAYARIACTGVAVWLMVWLWESAEREILGPRVLVARCPVSARSETIGSRRRPGVDWFSAVLVVCALVFPHLVFDDLAAAA